MLQNKDILSPAMETAFAIKKDKSISVPAAKTISAIEKIIRGSGTPNYLINKQ